MVILFTAILLLSACGQHIQTTQGKGEKSQQGTQESKKNQLKITLTYQPISGLSEHPSHAIKSKTYQVSLPKYPNMTETKKYKLSGSEPLEGPKYTATKKFTGKANETKIMNWYKRKFKSKSFHIDGQGTSGSIRPKNVTSRFFSEKNKKGMTVSLTFKNLSDQQTFVGYRVWYIPDIKRPTSSLIKGKVKQIKLIKKKGKTSTSKIITKADTIQSFVQAINQLKMAHNGIYNSSSGHAPQYQLILTINGNEETVKYDGATVIFRNQVLKSNPKFNNLIHQTFQQNK